MKTLGLSCSFTLTAVPIFRIARLSRRSPHAPEGLFRGQDQSLHGKFLPDALPALFAKASISSSEVEHFAYRGSQARGIAGRTYGPELPNNPRRIPTSVTAQGTPQAMASPMTLENPSEYDEEHKTSSEL